MGGIETLTSERVQAGDPLPELAVDVTATTVVLGAMASRDWRPMHHDYDFAVNRNGVKNIFLNTPNQAAWFERYLMKDSVFPGDRMVFRGAVESVETDDTGCAWVEAALELAVEDRVVTACNARIAIPATEGDNPWKRRGDRWKPRG
jgi:hypothetical protein